MAAGAATIYRNYFAPVDGDYGQTASRQLDGLADLGEALSAATGVPVSELWTMRNGYALATNRGLDAITGHLRSVGPDEIDLLRGKLRIGIHRDGEVTQAGVDDRGHRQLVSQCFCSALPVAYSRVPLKHWEKFALLVLEAAYEATLWEAVLSAQRGVSNIVFLTFLGGGAFGNADAWIHAAIRRALTLLGNFDLDVRLVTYGAPSKAVLAIAEEFR
jgi:hypothetical protein